MTAARLPLADRIVAGLLLLFSLMHAAGSVAAYPFLSSELVWAISASVLGVLLAALNFLRAGRRSDVPLAWICFAGCAAWAVLALSFGVSIGNLLDPRPLLHAVVALALAVFSLSTILRSAGSP
jgi:hypothetical protein